MMSASADFSPGLSVMLSSARKRSRYVRTAREKASVSPVVRPASRTSATLSRKSLASLCRALPCRGARGDHALPFGQPDLDRQPDPVVGLARVHISGDPLAIAETKDRLTALGLVARIGLEVRVLDRAEDDVLDVRERNQARPVGV